MNADFLFYGGCWVLQTGNIDLAFTDSIGRAMDAAKDMGNDVTPYWYSYRIDFSNNDDRLEFLNKIQTTCGMAYLHPFVQDADDTHITLAGYCIL